MATEQTAGSDNDFSVAQLTLHERAPRLGAHVVLVEPESKFYKFCVTVAQAFSLASLIAWFVLLIALIVLAFTLVNNLEAVDVMRDQQAAINAGFGRGH